MEKHGIHSEKSFGYRESEKFKEGLRQLEVIPNVAAHAKVFVLSVALDLKSACAFEVRDDIVNKDDLEHIFRNLGLFFSKDTEAAELLARYQATIDPTDTSEHNFVRYIVGNTQEKVAEVKASSAYSPRDHEAFGNALDYPTTAVAAFSTAQKTKDRSILMPLTDVNTSLTEEERKFSFFRFSKDHFEEEVAWLEQLIAGVKEYSPALYKQVMDL